MSCAARFFEMHKKITDREVYPVCWIAVLGLSGIFCVWKYCFHQPALIACVFFERWHIYCPGCGATRAVLAMVNGYWLKSLYYHPAVLTTMLSLEIYILSQTIWRIRKKRGFVLHYSEKWIWCMILLMVCNCIVRNLLWFGFKIPIS